MSLEAFVKERIQRFDPAIDLSPGSPFDTSVIQPIIARLGPDPFSMDLVSFIRTRLAQAFPGLGSSDADALSDVAVKAVAILWEPIVREVTRVHKRMSSQNPSELTLDEVEARASNLFATVRRGARASGSVRVYFAQPAHIAITPVNFFLTRAGLKFYPTELHALTADELALNQEEEAGESGLFFVDVNVIAELAGEEYNIGPHEIAQVVGVPSAISVKNPKRFRHGERADTSETAVARMQAELNERSLNSVRGIARQLPNALPEITRLNVVGFGDPEMQRDRLEGGGLGEVRASGTGGSAIPRGAGAANEFRVGGSTDLTPLLGPSGTEPVGWVLTVLGPGGAIDRPVTRVLGQGALEVGDAGLPPDVVDAGWTLRRRELRLSGQTAPTSDQVHIGGAYDVALRGDELVERTLSLDAADVSRAEVAGEDAVAVAASVGTAFAVNSLQLWRNIFFDSPEYAVLARAARDRLEIEILEGDNEGTYLISGVEWASGPNPIPLIRIAGDVPTLGAPSARWQILGDIEIELADPRRIRHEGTDLQTVQGDRVVTSGDGESFAGLGVMEGDVLRVLTGPDAGDFTLSAPPLTPGYYRLSLDRPLTRSLSGVAYEIFRGNPDGSVELPLVSVDGLELLDSSGQPLGTTIPYRLPVDARSRAHQNPSRGVRHDAACTLGIASRAVLPADPLSGGVSGTLLIRLRAQTATVNVTGSESAEELAGQINARVPAVALAYVFGDPDDAALVRLGLYDGAGAVTVSAPPGAVGDALLGAIFGAAEPMTSVDIRRQDGEAWQDVRPDDVAQTMGGAQPGFYQGPLSSGSSGFSLDGRTSRALLAGDPSLASRVGTLSAGTFWGFRPEASARVQIGARSYGSVRLWFLEPTTFEVDATTRFVARGEEGERRFLPDPSLHFQKLPPKPSDARTRRGEASGATDVFSDVTQDFVLSGVLPGDLLVPEYVPISGTIDLPENVSGVAGKVLIVSVDGGPERIIEFVQDVGTPGAVSRKAIVEQFNAALGISVAMLVEGSVAEAKRIEFETDHEFVVHAPTTAPWAARLANALVLGGVFGAPGESFAREQSNRSPHRGTDETGYVIRRVGATTLTLDSVLPPSGALADPVARQSYRVLRKGTQRISSAEMEAQEAESGLYYADIELVSEGTGDGWNLGDGQLLEVRGGRGEGYAVTTDDEALSFSPRERPRLRLSRHMLEIGVDDDPQNATRLDGQNIQLRYSTSELTGDAQSFLSSDLERVVNASPLARHLYPHYVRMEVAYRGGSDAAVVRGDIERHIRSLAPKEALEASDVQKVVTSRGADYIESPIEMIAVVHGLDRKVSLVRSTDKIQTGRLAAFFPSDIRVRRL